jgi:hypothetical protein
MIERGEVPIYEQCYGCSMREAFACLQDMRNNVTGNVPVVSAAAAAATLMPPPSHTLTVGCRDIQTHIDSLTHTL